MKPTRREIPVYGLGEYQQNTLTAQGVSLVSVEDSLSRRSNRMHPHAHPFFQVFLLESGTGAFIHDFEDYAIDGPTLIFTSPGQVHASAPQSDLKGLLVSFTQEFFDGGSPSGSLLDFPFFYASDPPPLMELDPGEAAGFSRLFHEMQEEFEADLPDGGEILRACLRILFTRAARLHARRHPSAPGAAPDRLLRRFRLLVEQRFRESGTLAGYAALLGVTANHLGDVVQERTGQPAGDLIRRRRLLEAKRLLLHSELSISEIAYTLNFQDPAYFSRFFRRYAGSSPGEFREEIREKYQRSASSCQSVELPGPGGGTTVGGDER